MTGKLLLSAAMWCYIINFPLAVLVALAILHDIRKNRKNVSRWWVLHVFLACLFLFFPTGLALYYTYTSCLDRKRKAAFWCVMSLTFSLAGYISFKIYDDCLQRRWRQRPLAAAALLLALITLQPHALIAFACVLTVFIAKQMNQPVKDVLLIKTFFEYVIGAIAAVYLFQLFLYLLYRLLRPSVKDASISIEKIKEQFGAGEEEGVILKVHELKKYFPITRGLFSRTAGQVRAVDGVDLTISRGETLGLVGESGCGKTTTGRAILNLIPRTSGKILFEGLDLDKLSPEQIRFLRREMQLIFQDPYESLNPRMRIGSIIGEALAVHDLADGNNYWQRKRSIRERVKEILDKVGLSPLQIDRYPHEFSGGQRQRIGIARAIALNPSFIVCDEPVSALDVSIQAQIINLLIDLQRDFNLSYLFIAHDLSVVEYISHRVAVMYLGIIVEEAKSPDLYKKPLHPYTQALMEAIPVPDPKTKIKKIILPGQVPSAARTPEGCRFHPRCKFAMHRCRDEVPRLEEVEPGHKVACFLYP